MIYFEFINGISPAALLTGFWAVNEKNKLQSQVFFLDKIRENIESFNIARKLEISHLLKPGMLKELCKDIPGLSNKEISGLQGDNVPIIQRIFRLSGIEKIDLYDIIIYLLLLIFLETMNLKSKVMFFRPVIGTASPEQTFVLFTGKNIIIDPHAAPVTAMCAAFLHYCTDSFANCADGILSSFYAVNDPLDSRIGMRIFEYDTPSAKSLSDGYEHDVIGVLETNIDDSTSEVVTGAMMKILDSGALDYTIFPVMMKKGRSGFQIQVLCKKEDVNRIAEEILSQTSTFGVRVSTLLRNKLQRKIVPFQTTYGCINVKLGYRGTELVKATPEFDDLLKISGIHHVSVYNLYNNILCQIEKGLTVLKKMIQ